MLRIFTLKFQSTLGAFDDAELQAFIKDKEVLSIRDHFFTKDGYFRRIGIQSAKWLPSFWRGSFKSAVRAA